MSKRHFNIENKENEEPNPAKKAKIIEQESLTDEEENEKSSSAKNDNEKPESLTDDEEEEEKEPWPIASVIEKNNGKIHPTNKQYFIYENTQPTMISNTARFWSRKYLKVLRHVNPDVYNVC
jgi:hypothetical protein